MSYQKQYTNRHIESLDHCSQEGSTNRSEKSTERKVKTNWYRQPLFFLNPGLIICQFRTKDFYRRQGRAGQYIFTIQLQIVNINFLAKDVS